jgi:uncharacterized membrane protein
MKKLNYLVIAISVIAIAAITLVGPMKATSQKTTVQSANVIPDNVSVILKKSCTSCHNEGGNGMAASAWSYSSWDKYTPEKQAKKANAICKAITKGTMPPSSVGKDRIPTDEQRDVICKWAASIQTKK